jgi:protein gp37
MGVVTGIEWCDHTFNPWIGCTKVSAACDHCYAETLAKRYGWATWGPGEARKRTSEANWHKPIAWNNAAREAGVRRRVFCSSLADVFDAEVSDDWRLDLMVLIGLTPCLDWLLLTKRPQVAKKWFEARRVPDNVWLGTTVEDQKMADLRIPILLSIPAKVRFLSCEPMLGPIDLHALVRKPDYEDQCMPGFHDVDRFVTSALHGSDGVLMKSGYSWWQEDDPGRRINWVIAGGESGAKARPSHPDWFRALRDQCAAAGVPYFFKQWGEWLPEDDAYDRDLKCIEAGPPPNGMYRVGKKGAGAMLDGTLHREFPAYEATSESKDPAQSRARQ